MELHQIRYFIEVSRHQNFSRAARHCNVSQPLLSQQISKLEDELGERLFSRSRAGAELTEFGRSFHEHATRIQLSVKSAEEFSQHYHGEITGSIKLGAIPTIAPYLIPKLIKHIGKVYPKLKIEIAEETTDSLLQSLSLGTVDFAILSPPFPTGNEVETHHLSKDELYVALPKGHPLSGAKSLNVRQIATEPFILMTDEHCLSTQTLSFCHKSNATPSITMRSAQIETTMALVEAGCGISILPSIAMRTQKHKKLEFIPFGKEKMFREVEIAWRIRNPLSRPQKAFLDEVKLCM